MTFAAPPRAGWEYATDDVPPEAKLLGVLSKRGQDGWELAAAVGSKLVFKRHAGPQAATLPWTTPPMRPGTSALPLPPMVPPTRAEESPSPEIRAAMMAKLWADSASAQAQLEKARANAAVRATPSADYAAQVEAFETAKKQTLAAADKQQAEAKAAAVPRLLELGALKGALSPAELKSVLDLLADSVTGQRGVVQIVILDQAGSIVVSGLANDQFRELRALIDGFSQELGLKPAKPIK